MDFFFIISLKCYVFLVHTTLTLWRDMLVQAKFLLLLMQ